MEPEDKTELLQLHGQTRMDELHRMEEQRRWFLEVESTSKDAVMTVEMTTKELEY